MCEWPLLLAFGATRAAQALDDWFGKPLHVVFAVQNGSDGTAGRGGGFTDKFSALWKMQNPFLDQGAKPRRAPVSYLLDKGQRGNGDFRPSSRFHLPAQKAGRVKGAVLGPRVLHPRLFAGANVQALEGVRLWAHEGPVL